MIMKPLKKLLKNSYLFRGECAYTIKEALEIMLKEKRLNLTAI